MPHPTPQDLWTQHLPCSQIPRRFIHALEAEAFFLGTCWMPRKRRRNSAAFMLNLPSQEKILASLLSSLEGAPEADASRIKVYFHLIWLLYLNLSLTFSGKHVNPGSVKRFPRGHIGRHFPPFIFALAFPHYMKLMNALDRCN